MAYRGDDRQSEFSNYVNTINSFESEYAQLNPFFNKNRPSQVQEVEEDSSSDDESSSDDGSVERKSFVTLEYDNEDDDDDESEDEDESENESENESEIDSGTEDEDEDDEDESSNSDSIEARYNMPQDIFTDEGQGQRTDRENITALESTMGELESSLKRYIRRLTILVAFTCLGLVILAILFALDPFSDEIVIPRLTAPPSNAPTFSSSDGTTVTTTYSALVPNDVSFDSITPDLIESMDKLAQEVLLEVTTSRKRTKRRILAEYEVRIPTSIAEAVDFDCPDKPTVSNFQCIDVTAHVVLITEDREITVIADFTIALDAAIEQGRLQECLSIVNPSLNVFLYKGDFPSFPTATPSTMPPSSPPPTPTILTLPPVPPPTPTQPSITTMPTQQPSENVVTDAPTAVPSHQPTQTITDPPTQGLVCDVLNTPLDGTAGQQVPALVFDMNALSDIDVKEISLHLKAESDLVVEIWTKEGTWSLDGVYPYVGTAWDRTGWTQVKSAVGVTGSGPSQLTKIGAFDSPVSLTAGSVQSFYIWTNSNNGLIKDITNGGIQAANSDLSIEFGAGFYIKPDSNPASGSLSIWGNGFEFEGTIDYCINNGAVGKKSLLPPLQELFLPPPLEELYQSTHQHQTSSLQNNTCYESLTCGQNTEGYNICLDMDVDEDTRKIALQAAERWTSIITGDLPPVNTSTLSLDATNQCSCGAPAVIDDLYLCIREGTMDGACDLTAESGCILGTGGFNNLRSDSQIPVSGVVTIDSADLVYLKANPDVFNDVMTHEIGHALGIGTLWERLSLRSNNTYIGKNAVDVWRKQYGCTDLPPLGSSGHWDEACFTDELMSPVLTFEDANPITKISVGALEDIGYIVDYTKAEDLTNNSVNKTACCNTRTGLRGFGENGHRNLLKKAISNLGEDDSTEKPSGISAALYSDAKEVAMKQLRKNRENAPKIRDDAGTLYVGDLFMHVYVLSNEGGFGSLGFVLPMDEDGGNP